MLFDWRLARWRELQEFSCIASLHILATVRKQLYRPEYVSKGKTQPSPFYSLSLWNAVAVLIRGWVCPSTSKLTHEAAAWTLYLCLCRTLIEHTRALDPTRPVTYITDSNYARDKGVGVCSTHFNVDTMSTWEPAQHIFFCRVIIR